MLGKFLKKITDDNYVINLKVKTFETKQTANGNYTVLKGVVGSKKGKDGKYSGGMRVDVMIPKGLNYNESPKGVYSVEGRLSWSTNEGKDGTVYNDCTVWATSVKPYEWHP